MPRPRQETPTPAELEILQVLWDCGPSTVREVMQALQPHKPRAYTTVMSLMNTMADKRLLVRKPSGKAFVYEPRVQRRQTLSQMVTELLGRAFHGSKGALVQHLLEETSPDELEEIRRTIQTHKRKRGRS